MRASIPALLCASACYLGGGPSVGYSTKHRQPVVGWEVSASGVAGATGGQIIRHDDRWHVTSWGALDLQWTLLTDHDARFAPLLHGQIGAAEGDSSGFVGGIGGGALYFAHGVCSTDYSFDVTLSVRRFAHDTLVLLTPRAGWYPYIPGCVDP